MWSWGRSRKDDSAARAAEGALERIDAYLVAINEIHDGFVHRDRSIDIRDGDQERLRRLIMEARDYFGHRQGLYAYANDLVSLYNEGRQNWLERSSIESVSNLRSSLAAARQLVRDAPEAALPRKPPSDQKGPGQVPADIEKVTLRWLVDHVPAKLWGSLVGLMALSFMAGVWAASNSVIRQLLDSLHSKP